MTERTITINPSTCNACGLCAMVCPANLLLEQGDAPPRTDDIFSARCIECGHCAAVCPKEALVHSALAPGEFVDLGEQPTPEEVLRILRGRRSVRKYKKREVTEESVGRLLEASRYAPSARNAHGLHCTVLLGRDRVAEFREKLIAFYAKLFNRLENPLGRMLIRLFVGRKKTRELLELLPDARKAEVQIAQGKDPLLYHAPALVIFHADKDEETGEVDCTIAADHLTLMAPALGLGTCYIGYASAPLKHDRTLSRYLGIPDKHLGYVVLTLGHAGVQYQKMVPRPSTKVQYIK